MKLKACLEHVEVAACRGSKTHNIQSLCMDSRAVEQGALFFCIPGGRFDGHAFAKDAAQKGAVALIVEHFIEDVPEEVTQVQVRDVRASMSRIAANFYGNPAQRLRLIAVTGTNGKTSITYMIKAIAEAFGKRVGLLGTIANMIGNQVVPAQLTTPDPIALQKLLYDMVQARVDWVVMEASAHALALRKLQGIIFDVGIFSNLTEDHLDFFGDMETYFAAKRRLFDDGLCRHAVINLDDAYGARMAEGLPIPVTSYGKREGCDVRATEVSSDAQGVSYTATFPQGRQHIDVGIPGAFSVYNSLAAAAACMAMEVPLPVIRVGLHRMPGVHGRCEKLDTQGRDYSIILDYAHTPDGLENILSTVRGFAPARVVAIFGCGGDRDPIKRPIMGEMAGKYADFCIITSDNPRSEDPAAIIAAIEPGVRKTGTPYVVIENRRDAIAYAMDHAQAQDTIVLAGKGHETTQEIAGVKYPFDEKEVVAQLLKARA